MQRLSDVNGHPVHFLHREGTSALKVWFVHGLGGWSATWQRALDHPAMDDWDIYVPDLPGFGRTPPSGDRSLASYAALLGGLISKVTGDAPVALVGHSLGGTVGTLLADARPAWLVGLVNVEGNLIAANAPVSKAVTEASDFDAWFESFADNLYRHGVDGYPPLRHVHAGLLLCDRTTFHALALDQYRLAVDDPPGECFARLPVPHVYYRGTDFPPEAVEFLAERGVPCEVFTGSGHFPMLDAHDDFYRRLNDWLTMS
jgi:pimeloyl-ACP methyl ester carboxylesterase